MELILLPLLLLAGLLTTLDGGSDGGDVSGAGDDDDRLEGSCNDQIAGGAGDDLLTLSENAVGFGGEGDDTLNASDEATAYGRAGDDSLTGSDNATIMGGDGNDSLTGSDAASLWGGAGDDTLLHSGDGQVHAGAGNDELTLTGLGAVVYGGDGDDSFLVTNGAAEFGAAIYGGAGVDTYIADHAANGGANIYLPDWDASDQLGIVLGTDDLSRFRFSVHPGSADGSDGTGGDITEVRLTETLADGATASTSFWLRGTYGYDVRNITLYGEDTDDELDGRAIFGDNDLIEASGSETVRGGIGNDDLTLTEQSTGLGGVGNDTLEAFDDATGYGLAGNDQLVGWDNATIMGGDGNDLLSGADDARAWGGAGDDRLFVYGDAVAYGGAGDDWLLGSGNAVLDGGTGEDTLIAANTPSGDFLTEATGGAGSDLFVIGDVQFGATTGDQIYTSTPMDITDFDPAQDQLGIVADPRILSGLEIVHSYSAPLGVTTVQLRDTSDYNTVAAFTLQGQHQIDPSDIAFFSDRNLTPIDFDFTGTAGNDSFAGSGHPAGTSVATGGAGDDSLRLDQGAVYGGAGDDTLTGQDRLDGGAGDDLIQLRTSEIQSQPRFVGEAYGGDGNDTLEAWEEDAFTSNGLVLDGGAGDDLIRINQSGAVTADGGDDIVVSTLNGGTITLGAGQDTLAVDVDDERGTTALTDFDPTTDELSILVPQADRAATSISLSTDATSGFVSLQITTGDTVQTLVLQGITSGVSLSSVRLYADEAALMAGTSYATA